MACGTELPSRKSFHELDLNFTNVMLRYRVNQLDAGVGKAASFATSFSWPAIPSSTARSSSSFSGNLLSQPQQVRLGFDALCLAGLLRHVEIATSTGHSVQALIEEIVRAVAVAEIVELPRFVRWASASDSILVDEDFDRSYVPSEVACILVRPGQLGWRDLCIVACRFWRAVSKPLLQFKQTERFFAL